MRSKTIFSIVAFIAAFGFSTVLASLFLPIPQPLPVDYSVSSYELSSRPTSCWKSRRSSATADRIADFIAADHRNGADSERAEYYYGRNYSQKAPGSAFVGYARAVEQYVDDSSSMNAENMPSDFQDAWREHMKAWRDFSNFLNRVKNSNNRANLSSDDAEAIDDFHSREITRTWQEVLRIGRSYGANVY